MELDEEEIKETKKIGKKEFAKEEALEIIKNEKNEYIVPGSKLDLAIEVLTKEFDRNKEDKK